MSGGGESYGVQSSMQNMRLSFRADGTAIYTPIVSPTSSISPSYQATSGGEGGGGDGFILAADQSQTQPRVNTYAGEPMKRKRGRPRKYAFDGSVAPGVMSRPPASQVAVQSSEFPTPTTPAEVAGSLPASGKKSRGRPPGSGRKQQVDALGAGFTPHVITVKAGEDVLAKLMSFSQNNSRAVCILSANGAISNVTLRQASTSGGTVTYEGRFEILSLSGSFLLSEFGGQRSRTGGLSVSLAGPDGRVLGGGVAGLLAAATPVQVIVGTFIAEVGEQSKIGHAEDSSAPPKPISGTSAVGSPPSRGTLSESSGGLGSPLNQNTGTYNNNNPHGLTDISWR